MKTKLGLLFLVGALLSVVAVAVFLRQARKADRALATQKEITLRRNIVAFQSQRLHPAHSASTKLHAGPVESRDIVEYRGQFYVASSNGLQIFSPEGKLLDQWSAPDGLPTQNLTALAVLANELWIATGDAGLIRFDGTAWKHYLPELKEHRAMMALLGTPQGQLFIGTSAGVLTFAGEQFERFQPNQIRSAFVTTMAGDSHRLWIGTYKDGLYVASGGVVHKYGTEEGLLDPLVTAIEPAGDHAYIATPSGIQLLRNGKLEKFAGNVFPFSLAVDSNKLWASVLDRGIIPLPLSNRGNSRKTASIAGRHPRDPVTEKQNPARLRRAGNRLLALNQGSIRYLKENRWESWVVSDSVLSDSNISFVHRSGTGEFWVGYFDHGLDILSADLQKQRHLHDDSIFCVNHISEDGAGRVYVSTANGLAIFEPNGAMRIYRESDGLLSDRVMQALPLDAEGKKVAIATSQGFTLKEGQAMKSIYAFHGLINNHVYTMAPIANQLFVGTLGGISSISNLQVSGSWSQMDSGLKRNWVNALMKVEDQLFVGTYGSGIQVRSISGDWINFDELPEDLEINPNAFFFDGRYLFCGTLDKGFFIYEPARHAWKHVDVNLASRNVTGFATDSQHLYIATDRGLLQISYETIHHLPDLR